MSSFAETDLLCGGGAPVGALEHVLLFVAVATADDDAHELVAAAAVVLLLEG